MQNSGMMASYQRSLWLGVSILTALLILLANPVSARPGSRDGVAGKDFLPDGRDSLSDNSFRHIMRLVSLGTGLELPGVPLRIREKSLKRARLGPSRNDYVIGSEFLGKRDDHEKRMGSEFLGKRMGSEFLGKRMGSEFLGKRMGSEFLGKRMGSEFLGKRMGSEFLGKRNLNDQRSFEDDRIDFFQDVNDRNNQEHDLEDSEKRTELLEKRMGSEFLGRRKRKTDETSNTQIEQETA